MDKPNYYAIIPASVRYDERLSASAKLLYGEITALTYKEGFCWASNSYFAKLYGVSPRAVRMMIEKLKKTGHVKVVISGVGNSERKMYPQEKNFLPPGRKTHRPQEKNFPQVLQENNTKNRCSTNNEEENHTLVQIDKFIPTFILEKRQGRKRLEDANNGEKSTRRKTTG
jgi:hypothetical protein